MADVAEDQMEQDIGSASTEKKGGLPIIPIIIAVVALVVIGGVVWFVVLPMLSPPPEEEIVDGDSANQIEPTEAVVDDSVYDPKNPPGIIEFKEPFLIKLHKVESVLDTETYLQVSISLEVESPEVQTEMEGQKAVIAIIQNEINQFFSSQYPQNVQVTQWPQLKQNLMDNINTQFPEEYKIKRVYFRDFLVQPGR